MRVKYYLHPPSLSERYYIFLPCCVTGTGGFTVVRACCFSTKFFCARRRNMANGKNSEADSETGGSAARGNDRGTKGTVHEAKIGDLSGITGTIFSIIRRTMSSHTELST